jgi:hypothetical protein
VVPTTEPSRACSKAETENPGAARKSSRSVWLGWYVLSGLIGLVGAPGFQSGSMAGSRPVPSGRAASASLNSAAVPPNLSSSPSRRAGAL